jgi:glycosyltransferase involved in cell wall biosynthesis
MKIAVDIRSLMDERYSGVSWYAFNLLKNLLAIDQKNEYLLFYNSHKKISLPEFRQDNVSYRGFKYPNKLFNLAVNFFGRPRLDRLVGGADVFLLPNLHFAAWSKDCRKALVVHDLSFVCFPEFFSRRMRLWQKLILRKRIIEQADILITDSQNTKKDLIRFFHLDQNKIQVVPLGIGEEYRPIDASDGRLLEIREKYDLPADFAL